jgi:hypothetical protein
MFGERDHCLCLLYTIEAEYNSVAVSYRRRQEADGIVIEKLPVMAMKE